MARDEESKKSKKTPKYNQGTTPRSNDHEILGQLAGRHLVLAFNCFKGLGVFGEGNQKKITRSFIMNPVLENNGWKDEKTGTVIVGSKKSRKTKDLMMDDDYLKGKIEKHVILDYPHKAFYAKDSTVEQQRNTNKSQGVAQPI
jgi:hypothetical protein